MSRNLGKNDAPSAVRSGMPGWRDPRLWIGVAIVAASVLLGAKVLGGADRTVAVWAVAGDMGSGDSVSPGDLVSRKVHFADDADAERYLAADEAPPADTRLVRAIGEGELLPRAALGAAEDSGLQEMPVVVPVDAVPRTVAAGSVIDVWLAPEDTAASSSKSAGAVVVLDDVVVLEAPRGEESFGPAGTRQLLVGVPTDKSADLPTAIAAQATGRVYVIKQA